jgi:amino acid transporter
METSDANRLPPPPVGQRMKHFFLGQALSPKDPHVFHKLSLVAFLAWVGLGADGISSACYGPAEAFKALGEHYYLAIILAVMTAITVLVISASYMQIIEQFPTGGGGYLVASKLLSPPAGAVAGCALLVDYVLTITTSIASGADAVFSMLPTEWHAYKLPAATAIVLVMIVLNMRGVKESVLPIVPVFILFLATHLIAIIAAFTSNFGEVTTLANNCVTDLRNTTQTIGWWGVALLILHAYSLGGSSYTGIEAVSNSMPVLREPRVETGKRTMVYMAISLAVVAGGLILGFLLVRVTHAPEGKTLNAAFFEQLTVRWPGGEWFVMAALASEALILLVAAQTGFLGGPAVLSNMALDGWMPNRFTLLSDRLVTQNGVLLMGLAAMGLMWITGGSVALLVVLYSINVFITFFLSQLGMVKLWTSSRTRDPKWKKHLTVNGVGLLLTTIILVATVCLKFFEGGWLTILITGSLVGLAFLIRRHYNHTRRLLRRLDELLKQAVPAAPTTPVAPPVAPSTKERTAVLLVNGFGGLGLHCLFGVLRLFKGHFKNFVFIQVGMIDVGQFKGVQEIQRLEESVKRDLEMYVQYMQSHGFYSTSFHALGTDVATEVENLAVKVTEQFPNSVLFASQLVFPRETLWTRLLHNYTAFAIQKRLYQRGLPLLILPIRV